MNSWCCANGCSCCRAAKGSVEEKLSEAVRVASLPSCAPAQERGRHAAQVSRRSGSGESEAVRCATSKDAGVAAAVCSSLQQCAGSPRSVFSAVLPWTRVGAGRGSEGARVRVVLSVDVVVCSLVRPARPLIAPGLPHWSEGVPWAGRSRLGGGAAGCSHPVPEWRRMRGRRTGLPSLSVCVRTHARAVSCGALPDLGARLSKWPADLPAGREIWRARSRAPGFPGSLQGCTMMQQQWEVDEMQR